MIITPLQSFGIGDIIFCQTLANEWIAEGHDVLWGVQKDWIEGLQRAYPNVQWVDYRTLPFNYMRQDEHDHQWNGQTYRVIPLRWSVENCGVQYKDCMKSKYAMFGKDWQDWRKGAMWQRDKDKEYILLNEAPNTDLPFGEESTIGQYNLIHEEFGSDVQFTRRIKVDNGLPNVYVRQIPGYSLFDWAAVYENATTIHAVSSSNIYIMEMLDLKATEIKLYKRDRVINLKTYTEPHSHYDYILQKHKYIFE